MDKPYFSKIKEKSHLDFNLKVNGKMAKLKKETIKSINSVEAPLSMNLWWSMRANSKNSISMEMVKGSFTVKKKK